MSISNIQFLAESIKKGYCNLDSLNLSAENKAKIAEYLKS